MGLSTACAGGPVESDSSAVSSQPSAPIESRVPVLAFYYIWYDATSWDRAKSDLPTLGKYSSDDPRVMRQQIDWAKAAGIDGFIVSWKSTPTNDRRLKLLMTVAAGENFKLAMIYQGLDFNRNPLPTERVAADFMLFRDTFATDPVFIKINGRTLTMFSGTWAYQHDEVATVTAPVRDSMVVLSTEKSVTGYQRLADVTDGDAYYWSSVNPDTNSGYSAKLNSMSQAIHADGKIWLAPFAPGFDARQVGGSKVVDRREGQTLQTQYWTARESSPDALGLISWNEFSENSYIEPSQRYGNKYVTVLHDLLTAPPDGAAADLGDSSSSSGSVGGLILNLALLCVFVLVIVVGTAVVAIRRDRRQLWPPHH
jgi:hypothetical protein